MDFGTAVLYVLAVIAIIAVVSLIVYALAGLVVSIVDKKDVKLFSKTEEQPKQLEKEEQKLLLEDSDFKLLDDKEDDKKEAKEEPKQEGETIDLDLADKEQAAIEANKNSLADREQIVEGKKEDKFGWLDYV